MNKPIYFTPEYNIGDKVALRINTEAIMVVDGYSIYNINEAGEVVSFGYSLYDCKGTPFCFKDIDLKLIERVQQC